MPVSLGSEAMTAGSRQDTMHLDDLSAAGEGITIILPVVPSQSGEGDLKSVIN